MRSYYHLWLFSIIIEIQDQTINYQSMNEKKNKSIGRWPCCEKKILLLTRCIKVKFERL